MTTFTLALSLGQLAEDSSAKMTLWKSGGQDLSILARRQLLTNTKIANKQLEGESILAGMQELKPALSQNSEPKLKIGFRKQSPRAYLKVRF